MAARWAGIETVGFCEIEPFPVEILKRRWPNVPIVDDVRTVHGDEWRSVDIVFGGFPCQDLSVAGKGAGLEGARSGLWFEMFRIIREVRPRWVLAENVRGAINLALDTVVSGLEDEGYKVWALVIPASAVGAYHTRQRLFVVAGRRDIITHINEMRQLEPERSERDERRRAFLSPWENTFGGFPGMVHGVPCGVAARNALANAVVPQQAYPLFRAIAEMERMTRESEVA